MFSPNIQVRYSRICRDFLTSACTRCDCKFAHELLICPISGHTDLLCLYFHLQKEEISGLNPQIRAFPTRVEEEFCHLGYAFLESYPEDVRQNICIKQMTNRKCQPMVEQSRNLVWNMIDKEDIAIDFHSRFKMAHLCQKSQKK
jgi:hypothetical protein